MMERDEKMGVFLKSHDPVSVSSARLEKLHAALFQAIEGTAQDPSTSEETAFLISSPIVLPVFRVATMGLVALMLGLFVGQGLEGSTSLSVQTEQKVSVLAMADPWESLILTEE